MPKKVMALAATLVLLLASAQLALAQQYPTQSMQAPQQQDTGGTQPTGAGQPTQAAPAGQPAGQNAAQNQPATGPQNSTPSSNDLTHLDPNNNLVIDCPAVSNRLAQLEAASPGTDPQTLSALTQVEELSRLCGDGGFNPSNGGGANNNNNESSSPNGTGPTQQSQQQSQGTSTPSNGGGNNSGSSPNDTVSIQPQQATSTHHVP